MTRGFADLQTIGSAKTNPDRKTKSYKQNIQELITMKLVKVRVLSVTLENARLKTLLW